MRPPSGLGGQLRTEGTRGGRCVGRNPVVLGGAFIGAEGGRLGSVLGWNPIDLGGGHS